MKRIHEIFDNKKDKQLFLDGKIFKTKHFEDFKTDTYPWQSDMILTEGYLRSLCPTDGVNTPGGVSGVITMLLGELEWINGENVEKYKRLDTMKWFMLMMLSEDRYTFRERYQAVDALVSDCNHDYNISFKGKYSDIA